MKSTIKRQATVKYACRLVIITCLFPEYFFYRIEITVSVNVVGEQIAHLRPLVPAVDCYQIHAVFVGKFLCLIERFFEVFRRIVLKYPGTEGIETRIVVPAYRYVRIICHSQRRKFNPVAKHFGLYLVIVAVDIDEMNVLIVGGTVKAEYLSDLAGKQMLSVDAGEIVNTLTPENKLKVKPGVTGFFGLLTEALQCFFSLLNTAETVYKIVYIVDCEHGSAADTVVFRLTEILFDDSVCHGIETRTVDASEPYRDVASAGKSLIPGITRVVVCPHYIELHFASVFRFEESVVKTAFEERAVIIPIPVVNENVYAVGGGKFDLFLHSRGICLVFIAERGYPGQEMPFKFRGSFLNGLPFSYAFGPEYK